MGWFKCACVLLNVALGVFNMCFVGLLNVCCVCCQSMSLVGLNACCAF